MVHVYAKPIGGACSDLGQNLYALECCASDVNGASNIHADSYGKDTYANWHSSPVPDKRRDSHQDSYVYRDIYKNTNVCGYVH